MKDVAKRTTVLPEPVRAEYPFPGELLELSSGACMHYLDEGSGPVVVLLHGNPTWSFFYRNLVQSLTAEGFRCVVPDHIGCGLSDKPQNYPYILAQRITDVEELLAALKIDRYSLVVHDWGGAIELRPCGPFSGTVEEIGFAQHRSLSFEAYPLANCGGQSATPWRSSHPGLERLCRAGCLDVSHAFAGSCGDRGLSLAVSELGGSCSGLEFREGHSFAAGSSIVRNAVCSRVGPCLIGG